MLSTARSPSEQLLWMIPVTLSFLQYPIPYSSAILHAGCTTVFRLIQCSGLPRRREALNMLTIYRYHPMFQDAGFEFWYPDQEDDGGFNIQGFWPGFHGRRRCHADRLRNSSDRNERTHPGTNDRIVAKKLFEKGAAERVIVALMTKDRAHMHLDTVFTLLDRDVATAYPSVVNNIRAISLRPGAKPGDFRVTEEISFLSAMADALKVPEIEYGRDRR